MRTGDEHDKPYCKTERQVCGMPHEEWLYPCCTGFICVPPLENPNSLVKRCFSITPEDYKEKLEQILNTISNPTEAAPVAPEVPLARAASKEVSRVQDLFARLQGDLICASTLSQCFPGSLPLCCSGYCFSGICVGPHLI